MDILAERYSGQIAWTSNFVNVCFSPQGLKQRTETRFQTIRLLLCIAQTGCSCLSTYFHSRVLCVKGVERLNFWKPPTRTGRVTKWSMTGIDIKDVYL